MTRLTDLKVSDRISIDSKYAIVYIAPGATNMCMGMDGLSTSIKNQFKLDPMKLNIFLFCNRKQDRIKILLWEKDGFVLLYKRLETGSFFWPQTANQVRPITPAQFNKLLSGSNDWQD